MTTRQTFIISLLFILLGIAGFLYKYMVLEYPLKADETSEVWSLEAKVEFTGIGRPVKLNLYLPRNTDTYAIVDERFVSNNYGLSDHIDSKTGNRTATWTVRSASGKEIVYYNSVIYKLDSQIFAETFAATPPKPIKAEDVTVLPPDDPYQVALDSLIEEIRARSADTTSFVSELYRGLRDKSDDRVRTIKRGNKEYKTVPQLANFILKHAKIPSRLANGVDLTQDSPRASIIQWLEIYDGGRWVAINNENGVPVNATSYFPWWYGTNQLFELEGGAGAEVHLSVKKNTEQVITQAIWRGNQVENIPFAISLFELPVDTQLMFRILLLVPMGGLVIAILRQMVGLKTFGTFMPVLVALAFRETQLIWGIILFCSIVSIGLLARKFLDKMQLLVVPRLAAILTLVIIMMLLISYFSTKLNFTEGLSLSLFPMVILTMTIERMSVTWEESGAKSAMTTAFGSLVAACIAYAVIGNQYMVHLFFVFPELLFCVLGVALMVGRYNGYKLSELIRFKFFTNPGAVK